MTFLPDTCAQIDFFSKVPMPSETTQKARKRQPVGRDEVIAAVIDAASDLFSELPVDQVTTRAIAERAGVNLGLIHRHCGSKEDVLHAVMERYAAIFRRDVLSAPDLSSAFRHVLEDPTQAAFVRTLAFVVLSGTSLESVVSKTGALKAALRMAKNDPAGPIEESTVLAAWSLLLGWHLFKPFLLAASETKLSAQQMSADVNSHVLRMFGQSRDARSDRGKRPASARDPAKKARPAGGSR